MHVCAFFFRQHRLARENHKNNVMRHITEACLLWGGSIFVLLLSGVLIAYTTEANQPGGGRQISSEM